MARGDILGSHSVIWLILRVEVGGQQVEAGGVGDVIDWIPMFDLIAAK